MDSAATTPIPAPVVQGIKLLALADASQRVFGSTFDDDLLPIATRPLVACHKDMAAEFGIAYSRATDLLKQVPRTETDSATDVPKPRLCLVVPIGNPSEVQPDRIIKTFMDYARSFRSVAKDAPWICLESQWVRDKMADFAENTQPIDLDLKTLYRPFTPRTAVAGCALEVRGPHRRTSKLSAVIQRSQEPDDVLEIYAEPVDNETLEFIRRC